MSAECGQHGTDLLYDVDDDYNGPSYCPSCDVEQLRDALREGERFIDFMVRLQPPELSDEARGYGEVALAAIRSALGSTGKASA